MTQRFHNLLYQLHPVLYMGDPEPVYWPSERVMASCACVVTMATCCLSFSEKDGSP